MSGSPCMLPDRTYGYFDDAGHCEAPIDIWDILFFVVAFPVGIFVVYILVLFLIGRGK